MANTLMVLDVNYLAWRAFYTTGTLQHGGIATGVIYGVLREIMVLRENFVTERLVFCFDHGIPLREKLFPEYKASRKAKMRQGTDEDRKVIQEVRRQIDLLKFEYLKELGYQNIFFQEGFEADDLIASIAATPSLGKTIHSDTVVIVSADKDLYQLLSSPRVCIWNPVKSSPYDWTSFKQEWGLMPSEWIKVKAIAGCSTDGIPGVGGVGEKTAAKYLRGELKDHTEVHKKIRQFIGSHVYNRNIELVGLPLKGVPVFKIAKDELDPLAWRKLTARLGMKSITDNVPVAGRR